MYIETSKYQGQPSYYNACDGSNDVNDGYLPEVPVSWFFLIFISPAPILVAGRGVLSPATSTGHHPSPALVPNPCPEDIYNFKVCKLVATVVHDNKRAMWSLMASGLLGSVGRLPCCLVVFLSFMR